MKKLIAILLAAIMLLSLCACGGGKEKKSATPAADELEKRAKDGDSIFVRDWTMYSWLTKNIDAFKNPASVELTGKSYYCKDESGTGYKFFLIECTADNSFGGKSSGYVKVTENGIVETDWEPPLINPSFGGESVWKGGTAFMEPAFEEYMSIHYGK